jgi:hypothetical protein
MPLRVKMLIIQWDENKTQVFHTLYVHNLRVGLWYIYIDIFLISNFCHVPNVVCFLLGNSLATEFYMPTFWNTLSVPSLGGLVYLSAWRWNRQSVLKHRHIKFRCWGITQKKVYYINILCSIWTLFTTGQSIHAFCRRT